MAAQSAGVTSGGIEISSTIVPTGGCSGLGNSSGTGVVPGRWNSFVVVLQEKHRIPQRLPGVVRHAEQWPRIGLCADFPGLSSADGRISLQHTPANRGVIGGSLTLRCVPVDSVNARNEPHCCVSRCELVAVRQINSGPQLRAERRLPDSPAGIHHENLFDQQGDHGDTAFVG